MTTRLIRPAESRDFPAVVAIYNHWITKSHVTFDTVTFSVDERASWSESFSATGPYRLYVADHNGKAIGFACSKEFRFKPAYSTSVETMVYLHPASVGRGLGHAVYQTLLAALEKEPDLHRAFAGIALPNPASVRLHEKLDFELVGTFRDVGRKFGKFWDVAWYGRNLSPSK